jgi:hypothetical protein
MLMCSLLLAIQVGNIIFLPGFCKYTVAGVIPAIDTLTSTLDPETKQPYHSSIIAAMMLARKKMDWYYSLTDKAAAYQIAIGKSCPIILCLS